MQEAAEVHHIILEMVHLEELEEVVEVEIQVHIMV
jgi:hypothetical protein